MSDFMDTPLMLAAHAGSVESCEALLDAGASLKLEDAAGYRPLDWAVHNTQWPVVRFLLSRGARHGSAYLNPKRARELLQDAGEL